MTIIAKNITKAGYFYEGKVHPGQKMTFGQNPAVPKYWSPCRAFINELKQGNLIL